MDKVAIALVAATVFSTCYDDMSNACTPVRYWANYIGSVVSQVVGIGMITWLIFDFVERFLW